MSIKFLKDRNEWLLEDINGNTKAYLSNDDFWAICRAGEIENFKNALDVLDLDREGLSDKDIETMYENAESALANDDAYNATYNEVVEQAYNNFANKEHVPIERGVDVICYGTRVHYDSRDEAVKFYHGGVIACEGSERDRYVQICYELANTNKTVVSDGEPEIQVKQKPSIEEQMQSAEALKKDINLLAPEGFPSFEEIKTTYFEFLENTKDVRTIEAAKNFATKYPVEIEINGEAIKEYERNGGTNEKIEWIRYETYGCLSYVYDRFDGKPMFDVWCDKGYCEFISDITIDNVTEGNYIRWVNDENKRLEPEHNDISR